MTNFFPKLSILTALFIGSLAAASPLWCAANYATGVDMLYWKPLHCDYVFGRIDVVETNSTVSHIFSMTADYGVGARVYAGYTQDCRFVDASYTWFQEHDAFFLQAIVTPVVLSFPLSRPVARLFFQYQNVDFRLGNIFYKNCKCTFYAFADARWAFMSQRRQLDGFFNNENLFKFQMIHKSSFSGAGLGVGAGSQFSIWNCFNGFGRLTALALIGNRQTPIESMNATPMRGAGAAAKEIATFRSNTCVIPAIDLHLGLDYQWDCGCLSTLWEVGYELDYYFHVLNTLNEQSNSFTNSNLLPSRSCKNIGFAGPYARFTLLF